MELIAKGIKKSFGAGNVLNGAELTVRSGEICALLGENGAGKSTFMNIIGGVFPADEGEVLIDGSPVSFASPARSQEAGIAFIHQDLDLVNDLTVYENLFLSGFLKKGPFLDKKEMVSRSRKLFERFGIELDPCALVGELDASYKQMTAISRALLADASLIIMDEPTSSLTSAEINRLFGIMRSLCEQGISMIFISHKLDEVMEVCDTYAVLRGGETVKTGRVSDTTASQIAAQMVGHEIRSDAGHENCSTGNNIFTLENLSDGIYFDDISLTVNSGEVLGITGLLGDGRSELFETVFGLRGGGYHGNVILNGKKIKPASPFEALSYGMAYVPKNRNENAVIPDMSIVDNDTNVILDRFVRKGFIDSERQKEVFTDEARELSVKYADADDLITSLSGGNQQKVILSEWLLSEPQLLILDNPTQGVDIGAKEDIYGIIEKLARSGMAIIVLSAEAQEIIRLCDRCLVMCRGSIAGELKEDSMNEHNMIRLASGAGKD